MNEEIINKSSPIEKSKHKLLKVPLAEVGKWFHKKWNTINFTSEYFEKAISNFKNNVLKHNPYLTYGHLKEPYSVDSDRRRGELLDLVFEDRYLFGIFDATEEAYQFVKDREYLYASAEIIPDFIDKDTGKNVGPVILRAALTNSPFLPANKEVLALSIELGFDSNDICVLSVHQAGKLMSEIDNDLDSKSIIVESEPIIVESTHKEQETVVESTVSMSQENSNQDFTEIEKEVHQEQPIVKNLIEPQAIEEPMTTPVLQEIKVESFNNPASGLEATTNISTNVSNTSSTVIPKGLTEHVHTLTESIKAKVATKYEAQIASYAQAQEALKNELIQLQERLTSKEQKAKAYELSICQASEEIEKANRQLLVDHMLGQGVPPVIANKFNEVSDAYLNKQSTIKLSLEGGEPIERTILDALAELIISASNSSPINLSQSGAAYSRPYDPTGRTQCLSRIIEKNNEIYRNELRGNV
jgi:hypothetical protein